MKKNNNLFWGLIFMAAALLLLIGQLEVFNNISLLRISIGILLIVISIWGLLRRNFSAFFFSIAFFFIIFDNELNIIVSPGPILGAALLGSIGMYMLFPKKRSYTNTNHYSKNEHFEHIINEADENEVNCRTQFGSTVKYVNTTCLTRAEIYCAFGGADVYFDATRLKDGFAVINFDVSFGGVEIYIPKNWEIEQNVDAVLGGVDIKGVPDSITDSKVILTGNLKFGGITIHYV